MLRASGSWDFNWRDWPRGEERGENEERKMKPPVHGHSSATLNKNGGAYCQVHHL